MFVQYRKGHPVTVIATVFFVGFSPVMPGTVGTLVALALFLLLRPDNMTVLLLIVVLFMTGVYVSEMYERAKGERDSKEIVIDEFLGFWIAVAFLPRTPVVGILGFMIFRFFDIIKPPPIRQIDRTMKGGLAVMLDDVLAAILTNLTVRIILWLT